MKKLALVVYIIFFCQLVVIAQTTPNIENGWKPYGSYDGTHLDTVNLMNGNLMLHAPLIPDPPQRGSLKVSNILYATSKDWQVVCSPRCSWQKGGAGVTILPAPGLTVHRTVNTSFSGTGTVMYAAFGYTIITPDQGTHQLVGVPATLDANGEPTQFDSNDLSGYHLVMSNPDPMTQELLHATVVDRSGNQYQGDFQTKVCNKAPTNFMISSPGPIQPMVDDAPAGEQYCPQAAFATLVTDSNGNQISLHGPNNTNPTMDTLGKYPGLPLPGTTFFTTDYHDCVSLFPITNAYLYSYQDPNGVVQNIKLCASDIPIQTSFGATTPGGSPISEAVSSTTSSGFHFIPIVTAVRADGTKWVFRYDSYGEISYIGLPTGGEIDYVWQTINYLGCNDGSKQTVSRAITDRTLVDAEGNSSHWHYGWGVPSATSLTNVVTDAAGNDTVHLFTDQNALAGGTPACKFYESSTIQYQGAASANQPLQRVDTTYSGANMPGDAEVSSIPAPANVYATDITTTVYPSNKVKKVHRDPDPGLGAGRPSFGNVIRELEYDWGPGAPGALLRETDTVYKWQKDSSYLTAHLLDLPASKVIISPSANVKSGCPVTPSSTANCMAETDYTYDEPAYLTTPSPAITVQHVSSAQWRTR